MTIQARVVGLIVVLFAVLALAQLAVQRTILQPSFAAIERQSATTDMARVAHAVRRELDLLAVSALNWGNWVDTYQYMADRNGEYVTRNLYPAAIRSMKIDALVLIAPDGHYVWSGGYDPVSGAPIDIDLLTRGALPDRAPWQEALRAGKPLEGLVGTNRGAMLVALSPILDGQGHGPHRGAALLGRLLTEAEVVRIGDQGQTRLTLTALRRIPRDATARGATPASFAGSNELIERETVTEIYRTFDDLYGHPLVTLRSEAPRTISARGRQVLSYALVFLLAAGAVALIALVVFLQRYVLAPLVRITRHAVAIGEHDATPVRLNLARNDELGRLASEFDRMMDRLLAARRELLDRSFEAGIAEMASGTLHNIGNAMTPLAVHVAVLGERLRAAPLADAELAASELAGQPADPARHADLVEFLRLTSLELSDTLRVATAELATIARQANAVQDALAEQRDFVRSGPVVESVALAELLERSAELVPDALRRYIDLTIDESIVTAGALRLPRTTLQQVFQNLIVNAAEAIRDAGRERGVLRVSAAVSEHAERGELQLTFEDDGVGIAAGNLARVFERGFTTKSRDTNSGIGLHWCANALAALGGSIRATSAGPSRGACMHISIPVDRPQVAALAEVA